jgi:hypothetical protein
MLSAVLRKYSTRRGGDGPGRAGFLVERFPGPPGRRASGARFRASSAATAARPCASSACGRVPPAAAPGARHGLGRSGRFGRLNGNSSPLFGLPAPGRRLRATENPCVDGLIPSLATTSNWMIRKGFLVSPLDHPEPLIVDPRTVGKWMGRGPARMADDRRCIPPMADYSEILNRNV